MGVRRASFKPRRSRIHGPGRGLGDSNPRLLPVTQNRRGGAATRNGRSRWQCSVSRTGAVELRGFRCWCRLAATPVAPARTAIADGAGRNQSPVLPGWHRISAVKHTPERLTAPCMVWP
jgi:hypothetical protein